MTSVIRRNVPIPASDSRAYLHATHGGANRRLEVYVTQGESSAPLDCTILGKYVFDGIEPTGDEVAVDVGLSYDSNGVVQVRATQRDTGRELPMTVEPVPDDLSWLGRPPAAAVESAPEPGLIRVFLLIDVSASMTGQPLAEAQTAARVPRQVRLHPDRGRPDLVLDAGRAPGAGDQQRPQAARGRQPARGRGEHEPHRRPRDGARPARRRRPSPLHHHPDRRLSRCARERGPAGGRGEEGRHRDRRDRHRRRRPRLPPPPGQQRAGVDLRPERRAGADLRPHRPRDRRGGRAPARDVMSGAATATPPVLEHGAPAPRRPGEPAPGL